MTQEEVKNALSYVIDPDEKKDIITLDAVSDIAIDGNKISFTVKTKNPSMHARKGIEDACMHNVKRFLGEDTEVNVTVEAERKEENLPPQKSNPLPNVKNIIAVASGKGGVGKSTVTSNLAVALAEKGFKVGVVDADIYGPSMPTMFDVVQERPQVAEVNGRSMIKPVEAHGVKLLSIGFFAEPNQAVVWRGPMASKALNQMFLDADWGDLDFMIIDLPPGTGDVHLSLVQNVPVTGAVVVSTPQDVAIADVKKAMGMFKLPQVNVPVLGLVENMAYFTPAELPDNKYYIFGEGGVKLLSEQEEVPFLGEIPIVQSIREAGDAGRPAVMQGDTPQAKAFSTLAERVVEQTVKRNENLSPTEIVQITTMAGCSAVE